MRSSSSGLKLTAIRDQLDSLLDGEADEPSFRGKDGPSNGRRELTIREALTMLCEREIARKERAMVRH